MASRRALLQLVVVLLSVDTLYCQSFLFPDSTNAPGLQVDSTGRIFLAAGNNLYRLSAQLTPEETVDLGATVITRGLALSSTGTVVVCLVDLSCSVYNGSNLSADPIRSVSNAIASADDDFGAAIITLGDTFYTGASTGAGEMMVLQQFGEGFNRSSNDNLVTRNKLVFGISDFARQFYGGFVSGNFAYYVVSDYRPSSIDRAIRLLRVCNNVTDCGGPSPCGVTALYEMGFNCGSRSISVGTRVCGVSLVEDFSGISGPTAVISIRSPDFDRNSVCVVNLTAVNEALDAKYDSCIVSRTVGENIGLAWRIGSSESCMNVQVAGGRCDTPTPVGVLAPDGGNDIAPARVTFGVSPLPTVSVAVKMEQFSFVFVATDDLKIRGYDVSGTTVLLTANTFYNQPAPSTVHQLSWQEGLNYITAATNNSVFRVPIEECSQRADCTSCTADLNPLCGWCVVENKCSRQTQCQNSSLSDRWTQDNANCVTATVDPMQLVLDPEIPASVLTVNLTSPGLPVLLPGETFSCHVADNEGRFPPIIVPAVEVTPRTVYNCSIAEMVPDYPGVTATISLGFQSSLFNVPFDITNQALTIYRCSAGESCKDCLGLDSPCGWCNLIKQCSGTSAPCRNESNFLQVSGGNTFADLCPLLDTPPTGGYTIPVRVAQDLRLTTRNLIPPTDGFNYSCSVDGVNVTAQYESNTSIVCNVGSGQLNLPEGTGSSSVVAMVIWSGNDIIPRPLSSIMTQTNVTLFDCRGLGSGCADCLASSIGSEFTCGWCKTEGSCEVLQECTMNDDFVTEGRNCPAPFINSIDPVSGPVQGGTAITVKGTNLGVTFADIENSTLTLQNGGCTPIDTDYVPGRQFVCVTSRFELGPGPSAFTMILYGTRMVNVNAQPFTAVNPGISSVTPTFGPLAGGTTLTVRGNDLRAGNHENTTVTLVVDGGSRYPCNININNTIRDVMAQEIQCTTAAGSVPSDTEVVVTIDNANLTFGVVFSYRNNPNVTAVFPSNTVPSGGITLTFTGLNMDVVQQPMLEVYGAMGSRLNSSCVLVNATAITCSTPSLGTTLLTPLNYSLRFDDAPPTTQARLPITVQPDPFNFRLEGSNMATTGTATIINIVGEHLDSVEASEIRVTVGGSECTKTTTSNSRGSEIFCTVPREPPGGVNPAIINVAIGTNISQALERRLSYTGVVGEVLPLEIIIPSVVGGFAVMVILLVLVMCCIICVYTSKHKKTEQRWTNLLAQMELLEIEMADECKRAFTELQTDLADLVHITDQNLPYRDFRTFAMRFLFPQAGDDHPVLHPLVLPEKSDTEQVATQLNSFRHLIMDKKFLLIFVRTLESQGTQFNLNDRSNVASLLMVCFQDDLDYATEILHLLLAELMRKSMTKNSHPKLMLRRTESVAEKMLANWLAFLLYPYLLEHVGEKLFILFRAIKSQLEKGPVDIITGEAKNSLSEEKLLRHHQRDIKVVDGVVVAESGEEFPVRLLDCDSITQSKEKVLDVLYKNTPVSKRPQLTEIDLELISTGAAGIPLRDQDATNTKDGEWIKVNTLGHYKLDEMSQAHADNPKNPVPKFRISRRPERPVSGMSFDMLGTIIANISANNRGSVYMPSDLPHTYHLVKPEPEDPTDGQRGQKIVSEVFLTRLLSTKRILQTYVDELFESVFAVPHGRPLPKAIKSLFDFLDQQAAELGIQDPEILHTWKTNSVPLRFWVNVIKNPDFLFDVNKSATVDSCLTVIAQAYIDACSTTDFKYTKDTPAARLLYVNDVKKYKNGVLQYYGTIQSLPKVSGSDMCQYLRETAQVCADSVAQYAPDTTSEKTAGPTSMKGQLYFITDSALYELFKFANKFSEEVTDGLKEEGLTIQAASFDQIKRNMRSATHTS